MIGERLPATLILMVTRVRDLDRASRSSSGVLAAVKRYSHVRPERHDVQLHLLFAADLLARASSSSTSSPWTLHWLPSQGIIDVAHGAGAFNTPPYWAAFWANPWPQHRATSGRHLVLPVVTLVAVSVAADSRFVRTAMLDTLSQDYVRTARAKGLPRDKVIFRHAFRNALLPIITNVALEIAFLFGGAIVTETIFSWPGMGRLFYRRRQQPRLLPADGHPVHRLAPVRGLMNLVADVIYAMADPRIRY